MEIELRARLLADATISTKCGTRVDWNLRPQGKPLPAITLARVPGTHEQTMAGVQATRGPLIQIDCWADNYADVAAIRDAAITLLLTPATQGSVRFMAAQNITDQDLPEQTDIGPVFRSMIRANVWHTT